MTYSELADFIVRKMQMQHIYQPVMIVELLKNNGVLKDIEISKKLLSYDSSQIDYYTKITNNMVGRILRKHDIVSRDRATKEFRLIDFEHLSSSEIDDLISLCEQRLTDYFTQRGHNLYSHRKGSTGYISGTIRYEVLKRAKFHCELCGISAEKKALEIDHILPKNKGGSDEITNLQALCYSCNSMKRDRDDTDFRIIRESYDHREEDCLFCNIKSSSYVQSNELAFVILDSFPVTKGHSLIIPKRHTSSYFDLGQAEINACNGLLQEQKKILTNQYNNITGFNVGINDGKDAGQTISHCHIHLIPRRKDDTENPTGGVRSVIPSKADYLS